jgi:hypothetical protein
LVDIFTESIQSVLIEIFFKYFDQFLAFQVLMPIFAARSKKERPLKAEGPGMSGIALGKKTEREANQVCR